MADVVRSESMRRASGQRLKLFCRTGQRPFQHVQLRTRARHESTSASSVAGKEFSRSILRPISAILISALRRASVWRHQLRVGQRRAEPARLQRWDRASTTTDVPSGRMGASDNEESCFGRHVIGSASLRAAGELCRALKREMATIFRALGVLTSSAQQAAPSKESAWSTLTPGCAHRRRQLSGPHPGLLRIPHRLVHLA